MPTQTDKARRLYGTKEIAEILNIEEWRVKNFSQGAAYGLPPTQLLGKGGRGSRRLYSFQDFLRIAIASELEKCGFDPKAVGQGVAAIPQSKLESWAAEVEKGPEALLVCRGGKWQVMKPSTLKKSIREEVDYPCGGTGLFILNYPALLCSAVEAEMRMAAGEERRGKRQTKKAKGGKR